LTILKRIVIGIERSVEENQIKMRIIINKAIILFAFVAVIVLTSCGPNEYYYSSVGIPEKGWHKDTVAVFKSDISQLDKSCHVLLEVQNNEEYVYSNIWFFLDVISPSGYVQRDTINCILANDQGEWLGDSNWSNGYKSLHPYKLNIRFPKEGLYTYYVVQGMRDTVLIGIDEVGVKIIEAKEQ